MKYKAGDIVRVRDWDDMEKQYGLDDGGNIHIYPYFTKDMKQYCGKDYKVSTVFKESYNFEGAEDWVFTDEMLTNPSFNLKINGEYYTDEQFMKDYKRFIKTFPEHKTINLSHAMEDIIIVYNWSKEHPANIDFYANKYHWTEEQKENIRKHGASLPNFMNPCCSSNDSKEWWEDEYKTGLS